MSNQELFFKSAITENSIFISTSEVLKWISDRNNGVVLNIERVRFKDMDNWIFDYDSGVLRHTTGKFFSITGIEVTTNWGKISNWSQPIINQPEVGYLGIITKKFNGVLYFLLQAKIEPGNVNNVQLSPTLQATKSNYQQMHKGKVPLYLEYFQHVEPNQILLDQLQSEQGARFLHKRNRNMIIKLKEEIPVYEDYIWLTLGQIKKLMSFDNVVNMDTRTVISGIPFEIETQITDDIRAGIYPNYDKKMLLSATREDLALNNFDQILNWLTAIKCRYELEVRQVSLFSLKDWRIGESEIVHFKNKYFKVLAARVHISTREVQQWTQPLIEPLQKGITAFVIKEINGVYHFLVQAKLECGNFDIVEIAPTVQCITDSYNDPKDVPFLDLVLSAKKEQIRYDTMQSEEGGRFFREQNRNMILEVDDSFDHELPHNYFWITLKQINTFLKFNNFLNIQARSIISAINFI